MDDNAEKTFDDFRAQIAAIQNEMFGLGIASIVILHEANPIASQSVVNVNRRGETFQLRGMIDYAYEQRESWK